MKKLSKAPETQGIEMKTKKLPIMHLGYSHLNFYLQKLHSGFGKVQMIVLVVCGLILMAVINETMGMAIIIPAAQCDLALSSTRKGVISAVSFIGKSLNYF